jgi:hypothetical protein
VASERLKEVATLVAAWSAAAAALHFLRHLPWSLATIAGFAIAVLVVVSWRTGRRLRAIHNRSAEWRREDD